METKIYRPPQNIGQQGQGWKQRIGYSAQNKSASVLSHRNRPRGLNGGLNKVRSIISSKLFFWIVVCTLSTILTVWLLTLLWGGFINYLAGTSWSKLDRIEVIGLERLNEQEIINTASVPMSANLMKLDKDSIAARINAHPSVRQSRVITSLPGKLKIIVEERQPLALVTGAKAMLTDGDGFLFPLIENVEVIDLPILQSKKITPDGRINDSEALAILGWLHDNYGTMYSNISEVSNRSGGYVIRIRQSGAMVKVNDVYDLAVWESLECFLMQNMQNLSADLAYVDLRFPGKIVTGTEKELLSNQYSFHN